MRFHGLDGKVYTLSLTKYIQEGPNKSDLHLLARRLIKQVFGLSPVCEEFTIPGTLMKLDFYISHYNLAIEVQGNQHEEFTPFFHGTKQNFNKAVQRDASKEKWCEINNIKLVKLYDRESEQEWLAKLTA